MKKQIRAAKVSQAAARENTVDVGEVEVFSELSGNFRVSLFKFDFFFFVQASTKALRLATRFSVAHRQSLEPSLPG